MATTRSSLANAEARLRRSLGLAAGPVGLELTDPLPLLPVVLTDDATRPGTATQMRGRRWKNFKTFSVAQFGACTYVLYIQPNQAQFGVPITYNQYESGVIIDRITIQAVAGAAAAVAVGLWWQSPDLISAIGLPVVPGGIGTQNTLFVDPMRVNAEPAPIWSGTGPAVNPTGFGPQIWGDSIGFANGAPGIIEVPAGDIFMNTNSALIFGTTFAPEAIAWNLNFSGRIF